MKTIQWWISSVTTVAACSPSLGAPSTAAAPAAIQGGPLLRQDFNRPNPWPQLSAAATPKAGVTAVAAWKPLGTVDAARSVAASGAVTLFVETAPAASKASWSARLTSGLLPVRTPETNLGKLTLSFDHSVSAVRPVTVQIESFDAQKRRTGGREGVVYPAAPDFYLRSAIELSAMRPLGANAFRPQDPFIRITFKIDRLPMGAEAERPELRIDNVAYSSPAFYVSPSGSDKNDGRTEKTAFADPQKAVNLAQPGDIIVLMKGTYTRASTSSIHDGIAAFRRAGTPAAWIVLKNYPGHKPTLTSDGWNAIKIGRGTKAAPSVGPALAYLEVRGLHIRGNADTAKEKYAAFIDQVDPRTNGNGISGSGGSETNTPHHLRFADNLVEYCSGAGIGTGNCDWVTIENNTIRNNCWWVIYATSGISLLGTANFDATENVYKDLVRNNHVSGNRCYQKWKKIGKISDGNGIIVDSNHVPKEGKSYLGRTLIQNNLTFNNGGSGIHAYKSHRIDIVNNTAYWNGASPELRWGQIFVQSTDDAHIVNNILVSREDQPVNTVGKDTSDKSNTRIVRAGNVYFGGNVPPIPGTGDVIADPRFHNASPNAAVADFHLRPDSPAIAKGVRMPFLPYLDLDGKPLKFGGAPDGGAFQYAPVPRRTAAGAKSK